MWGSCETKPIEVSLHDVHDLPSTTGVYFFVSKTNEILYIGKSNNIRARVKSHIENAKLDAKEYAIVRNCTSVRCIVTDSEFKALVYEANLIKKYKPKYNSRWRDDKSYLYIKISIKDEYPKMYEVRNEDDGKSLYFGPYSSTRNIRILLKEIRKIIPFCAQKKIGRQPCFYSNIGLCDPCPGSIVSMNNEARQKELKKVYIANIRRIIRILQGETDVIIYYFNRELQKYIKTQDYEHAIAVRDRLIMFENLLHQRSFNSDITTQYNLSETYIKSLLSMLRLYFPNLRNLTRIECYDISSLSQKQSTASMVVFTNGLIDKSQYRKFKIRSNTTKSDFEMLTEVIQRRFRNLWPQPDLIVIDGGRPQIRVCLQELRRLNIAIPLIGIAKHPDRLIAGIDSYPIMQAKRFNDGFNLIRYIRDESHRFAKKYHLLLRKREMKIF